MSSVPKIAKVHSSAHMEMFVALGWVVEIELKAENGEIYEWVLEWRLDSTPVRPSPSNKT
jgi:hypothetical protein